MNENQPAKMAAMEAVFDDQANAPLYLFGWVNEENQKVNFGLAVPGLLSYLIAGTTDEKVEGLNSIPENERPPVNRI